MSERHDEYGGDSTVEKLDALQRYADKYTTVLKDQPKESHTKFMLHYVDAFANNGIARLKRGAFAGKSVPGSVQRALDVTSKSFDRLWLIDNDPEKCKELHDLVSRTGDAHRTSIVNGDANDELMIFCQMIGHPDHALHRAFVFIDPYALTVNWSTVEALARTTRCDVLMLFPLMAVRRLLKVDGWPRREHQVALDRFFGGDVWRELYTMGPEGPHCDTGYKAIVDLYTKRLDEIFVRVVNPQRALGSSMSEPRFTLLFAASNESGAEVAARIAKGVFRVAHGPQMRMPLC